jgi:predicted anti-sigma-YlaC factor YlaD
MHDTMSARLTCEEAIAMLVDYLESTLDEATVTLLDAHLADCEPCRAYLATYRRTIGVVGESERVEMPLELRRRLTAFLAERLRAKT